MSKQISKIYHAAIYVRLSKEDGDVSTSAKAESNSISNQKDFIRNFLADKKDIRIVKEYVDDGYSGSNFDRPSFQTMMEDIKRGVIDCVVVKDLSRFGREYILYHHTINYSSLNIFHHRLKRRTVKIRAGITIIHIFFNYSNVLFCLQGNFG